ncbi:hypothetical protein C8046_05310 [Serinibacter arcticus]|uniref:ABC transporter domain-containing protein n=1 Tax=Serinibacter arcticus TaxID=1655435 RepID=A0A2U1ZT84_9MICO|nr:hypothetical protein C8046_05310 [Serinibacter arcticus]
MRFRLAPLRAAAILAAAFVAARVVYRGLFDGLDRDGTLLLDLPAYRLPEPVDHVVLLGPITTGGVATAVVSALPIAAVIAAFGLLNAVLDVPALCARLSRGGPLRSVGQALVIAWATFPGLVRSVTDVRRARRLRGERGAASLLVPVMERTVERAVTLGASMEVRGFAGDAATAAVAVPGAPAVELHDASFGHDGDWRLRADLAVPAGRLVVLTGATGSGKSTLLRALSGLHQHADGGRSTGTVRVLGVDRAALPHTTAGLVGVVPQHPRLTFVAETVAAEIAFGCEVLGLDDVDARVHDAAERLGVSALLEATPVDLSAGESHLVALAAAVAHGPQLLLVDEPLADLDAAARARVVAALTDLVADGRTVVVAEHRTAELEPHVSLRLVVEPEGDGGARVVVAGPAPAPASLVRAGTPSPPPTAPTSPRPPVLQARVLHLGFGERTLLRDGHVTVGAGEILAVTGDVGSGKTSLLGALALPTHAGVEVDGADVTRLRRRRRPRHLALVPDASDDLLFRLTVAEEAARADRLVRAAPGSTLARFLGFVGVTPNDDRASAGALAARHPRDLSVGQRRLLVLAVQLAAAPSVLLVDEPGRGLDPDASVAVRTALLATAEAGTAVVLATHEAAFVALAHRTLALRDGSLVAVPGIAVGHDTPATGDAAASEVHP